MSQLFYAYPKANTQLAREKMNSEPNLSGRSRGLVRNRLVEMDGEISLVSGKILIPKCQFLIAGYQINSDGGDNAKDSGGNVINIQSSTRQYVYLSISIDANTNRLVNGENAVYVSLSSTLKPVDNYLGTELYLGYVSTSGFVTSPALRAGIRAQDVFVNGKTSPDGDDSQGTGYYSEYNPNPIPLDQYLETSVISDGYVED